MNAHIYIFCVQKIPLYMELPIRLIGLSKIIAGTKRCVRGYFILTLYVEYTDEM